MTLRTTSEINEQRERDRDLLDLTLIYVNCKREIKLLIIEGSNSFSNILIAYFKNCFFLQSCYIGCTILIL